MTNNILQLKGRLEQGKYKGGMGVVKLPKGAEVSIEKLNKLKSELVHMKGFWQNNNYINGALVSVHYNKIAAKSNRIQQLLKEGSKKPNGTVVGARFTTDSKKHIITHYVKVSTLDRTIEDIDKCIKIMKSEFNSSISKDMHDKIGSKGIEITSQELARSEFLQLIVDSFYVEKFDILREVDETSDKSIVTIFNTGNETVELLSNYGINISKANVLDDTTILLQPDQLDLLRVKAPYLIAMAVSDIAKIEVGEYNKSSDTTISIQKPFNEPTIGVIDTLFDESVYFSDWVEYKDLVSKDIEKSSRDYRHGTAVSSIIVDGATINPNLDDGCGRFRVKHFGVATETQFSSFTILKKINEIVLQNRDIKVWNISLGSKYEVNQNFISPEAALLDKIQAENDVIFIIAGTNKSTVGSEQMKIGAPADSINGLVVNSVTGDKQPASYTRTGPVLSFFTKPDVSYYGGDIGEPMRVCTPTGESFVVGTSFAAPWIARKMAYLICILGLSREVAKGLLIHSSTEWKEQEHSTQSLGHGIVPIRIEDITESPKDEIRFILSGISEEYYTYAYNIPVPITNNNHPFIAKATLCYFPYCSRNQGVDYTNTELDLSFGRINGTKIESINDNYQSDQLEGYTYEEDARRFYRKWDNIKHIREVYKKRGRDKKAYTTSGLWGVRLTTKERLEEKFGKGIKFGIIVSLKEIHGVNRIEEFKQMCMMREWIVSEIKVENRIDIYNKAEEVIELE